MSISRLWCEDYGGGSVKGGSKTEWRMSQAVRLANVSLGNTLSPIVYLADLGGKDQPHRCYQFPVNFNLSKMPKSKVSETTPNPEEQLKYTFITPFPNTTQGYLKENTTFRTLKLDPFILILAVQKTSGGNCRVMS